MQKLAQEFKDFLTRGNLVELAIAFVMGIAFSTLVTAFIDTVINPILGAFIAKPSFSSLTIPLWSDARIAIGAFIMAVISFAAVAATVFFAIVKPYNAWKARQEDEEAPPPPPEDDESVVLLREIRDSLSK